MQGRQKRDVKAVKKYIESLKVEKKINQESRINILSGHLSDVKNSRASHEQLLARAQRNLASCDEEMAGCVDRSQGSRKLTGSITSRIHVVLALKKKP